MRAVLLSVVFIALAFAVQAKEDRLVLVEHELDLGRSEVILRFDRFDSADWTITRNPSRWTVEPGRIVGGGPDDPHTGQIMYRTPVQGDIVMEFDARLIPPSYHDFVWLWNARFAEDGKKSWTDGCLASLGGWWNNLSGIEMMPNWTPKAISGGFELKPGVTYHIVSGSWKNRHFICVDGKLVTWLEDLEAKPLERPGYFGFGVYRSHVEYSNLTIYRPCITRKRMRYEPASQMAAREAGLKKYLVIDIAAGPEAERYSYRHTDDEPEVDTDKCRGDEIWLRRIGAGSFEVPAGRVELTRPYYIGIFEVTQRQWRLVMGTDPSELKGDFRPIDSVSWDDAQEFFRILSEKTQGLVCSLPTGAEWEFACRAGTASDFCNGGDGEDVDAIARTAADVKDGRGGFAEHTRVGSYAPNAWGVYDMHGNVWEWVSDWRLDRARVTNPPKDYRTAGIDPQGVAAELSNGRMRRGGSWHFGPERATSAATGVNMPDRKFPDLGFRMLCRDRRDAR